MGLLSHLFPFLSTVFRQTSSSAKVPSHHPPLSSADYLYFTRGVKLNKPLHNIHQNLKNHIYNIAIKGRRKNKMCKYTINVTFKGKIYQTNVLANKNKSEDEVYQIAKEQVLKQLAN
jgi:hypothetical protein